MNKFLLPAFVHIVLLTVTVNLEAQSIFDNTQLRLFSYTEASSAVDSSNTRKTNVELGDIEMLLTAQLNDKITVLSEVILTPEGTVEIDRMMLKYQFNDYFHLSAGKLYIPIGLWNNTFYHQARVLTPTIDHPVIIADKGDFGVIDNKDEGLQFGGENISKYRFGYRLYLSNGFSSHFENTPTIQSLTYNLFAEPVDNLKIGVSGQLQTLEKGSLTSVGPLASTHDLSLFNASIMYLGGSNKFEFSTEFFETKAQSVADGIESFNGFFVYTGYKLNKLVPYFMYNKVSYNQSIEVYPKNNFTGTTVGLRYKLAPLSVLKLEAQFLECDEFKKLNRIELQWAVGY
jgi:hypothetical protein